MFVDWKIYYDNGDTYSNLDGIWKDAPNDGVIGVVVRDVEDVWGRFIYTGHAPTPQGFINEFYIKHDDNEEPYATWDLSPFLEKIGLFEKVSAMTDLIERGKVLRESGYVKFGRQVGQNQWQSVMRRMIDDSDFNAKSPRRRHSDYPSE